MGDTGRYQCTAINDAGEDSKSFDVEVQSKYFYVCAFESLFTNNKKQN